MGGVHPSGQNVVRLGQHAGGHNCNMGEPYFDVNEVINDVRLTSIISREEIQDKVLEATKKVQINQKRCCRQMIPLIIIMIVMPQMFRFLEPATVVCNSSGSTEDSTESCYVKCCPNQNYDEYEAEHEEEHDDMERRLSKHEEMTKCTTNFTEVEYYTEEYVENGKKLRDNSDDTYCNCPEDYQHEFGNPRDDNNEYRRLFNSRRTKDEDHYNNKGERRLRKKKNDGDDDDNDDDRYRDEGEEKRRVCKGFIQLEGDVIHDAGSSWLLILFIPMWMGSICLIFFVAATINSRLSKQLTEVFSPWAQKGINISYYPRRKHSQGAIYFHINNQMMQGQQMQQMVVMQNGQQVVRYAQPPHQQQQQQIYYVHNNGQQQQQQQQPMMIQGTVMQAPKQQQGMMIMQQQQQQQQQQPIVQAMAQPIVVNNNSVMQPMPIIQPINQTQQLQPTLVNQTSASMQQNNNVVQRI